MTIIVNMSMSIVITIAVTAIITITTTAIGAIRAIRDIVVSAVTVGILIVLVIPAIRGTAMRTSTEWILTSDSVILLRVSFVVLFLLSCCNSSLMPWNMGYRCAFLCLRLGLGLETSLYLDAFLLLHFHFVSGSLWLMGTLYTLPRRLRSDMYDMNSYLPGM